KSIIKSYKRKLASNKWSVILFLFIFFLFIFLRFYEIEERSQFHIDQVNDAWVVKNFIIDGKIPLLGTPARLNSGIFMGPFYYYYLSGFYYLTNLDPVASGIASGVAGVVTLITIFFVARKLFSTKFALIAILIYTVSYAAISADRIQWTVNFLVPVSILMFYALYKVITGSEKYLLLLGIVLGLSFHVHFTSVFYLLIILLSLPFFPRTRTSLKYLAYGIIAFLIIMLPSIIHMTVNRGGKDLISYLSMLYHGLHLRRVMQLTSDAFIQFEQILFFPQLKILEFFLLPLFGFVFLKEKLSRNRILFIYLAALWFLVPWFILSLYSGEITDYYFLIGRPIVILVLSYFLFRLIAHPLPMLKVMVAVIIIGYAYTNIYKFLTFEQRALAYYKIETIRRVNAGEKIEFFEGSPESYLYYLYKERYER
ncbi:MAG: glycosyltransferase family 39 protein, partial [Nanoarchaeota archaeon]